MNSERFSVAWFVSIAAVAAFFATAATSRGADIFISSESPGIAEYDAASGATINSYAYDNTFTDGYAGFGPLAISGNDLFFANPPTGTVGEYTTAGAVVNASLITGLPLESDYRIAASGGDLFVTDRVTRTISEFDATTGATINASLVSELGGSLGFSIASSGSDLFVADNEHGTIAEYTTSGTTVNASLVTGLNFPSEIAVSGGDLFVANNSDTISVYDATTGATINAALVTGLDSIAGITVYGGDVFVTNRNSGLGDDGTIGAYDATTGATINASLVTGLQNPEGIVVVTPEPSTSVMLVIGALAIFGGALRKRHS